MFEGFFLSILCSPSKLVDCLDYVQDPIKHSLAVKFLSIWGSVSHQSMGILLYEVKTYIKLSLEAMEILIAKIRSELSGVGGRYKSNNLCPSKEKDFFVKENITFTVPHLYTS